MEIREVINRNPRIRIQGRILDIFRFPYIILKILTFLAPWGGNDKFSFTFRYRLWERVATIAEAIA